LIGTENSISMHVLSRVLAHYYNPCLITTVHIKAYERERARERERERDEPLSFNHGSGGGGGDDGKVLDGGGTKETKNKKSPKAIGCDQERERK